jgi:hypothetical protein
VIEVTELPWGLWSHARKAWQPDPVKADGTPARFATFREALLASARWHESCQLEPRAFESGEEIWAEVFGPELGGEG